ADVGPVHHGQRLHDGGLSLDGPLSPAGEQLEESGPSIPRLGSGGLGQAVEELAGREATNGHRGEQGRARFALARPAREVVRRRRRRAAIKYLRGLPGGRDLPRRSVDQAFRSGTGSPTKLSTGSIRPIPKNRGQARFTTARAKNGLSAAVTPSARISRVSA